MPNESRSRLTVKKAAALIGCHPQTVRKHIKGGKLDAEKAQGVHGPEWRIDRESAESLAASLKGEKANKANPEPAIREALSRLAALEAMLNDVLTAQKALPPAQEELAEARGRAEAAEAKAEAEQSRAEASEREAAALKEALDAEKRRTWWDRLRGR